MEDGDPPWAHGPYHSPVDRFAHLPESTRKWLEQLREEDIKTLRDAVQFQHSVATVGHFVKWMLITIVGSFVGAAAFGRAIMDLWGFILSGGKH